MVPQGNEDTYARVVTGTYPAPEPEADGACHADSRDATAFWDVWQYTNQMLVRRCRQWMGHDQAEADDALSEACLRAWQGWTKGAQPILNVPGWLSRLVHNHCRTLHTVQARRARLVQCVENIATVGAHAAAPGYPSPEDVALHRELGHYICQAIDDLPTRLQEPACLYFVHDVAYADIAVRLHLTPANVRKRIQQARVRLQAQIAAYLAGETPDQTRRRLTRTEKNSHVAHMYGQYR